MEELLAVLQEISGQIAEVNSTLEQLTEAIREKEC